MKLEKAGLSCCDLQQGLHPGDAEAAVMALPLGHAQGAAFIFPGFTERSAGGKLKQDDLLFLGQRLPCERKDETPLVGKKC